MMKKLISTILCLFMLFSILPGNLIYEGFATDLSNELIQFEPQCGYVPTGNEIVLKKDEIAFETFSDTNSLPLSYDLRDYGRVTSVKDQGPLGTCWAFAFCAAAESNLITQGLTDSSIDLSEAHLAYFTVNNSTPNGNEDILVNRDTFNGGEFFSATSTVAHGSGFTLEQDYPYLWTARKGTEIKNEYEYQIKDTYGNSYIIDANEMVYPETEKYKNNYTIKEVNYLSTYNEVKEAIITNGAVAVSMYFDETRLYNSKDGWTHYYNGDYNINHGVTIVGWDDSFSKSNFIEEAPIDGAWLIKNSWGEDDTQSDSGYFWISYCESLSNPTQVIASSKKYSSIYQYDEIYPQLTNLGISSDNLKLANVFSANDNALISGTSFYTPIAFDEIYPIEITAQLYTSLNDETIPNSGVLSAEQKGIYNTQGYYVLNFDTPIEVKENENFSIVLSLNDSYSNKTSFLAEFNTSDSLEYKNFTANTGESFYSSNGGNSWRDFTSISNSTYEYGNICIKAFSTKIIEESISITQQPKTNYFQYDELDLSDLELSFINSKGEISVLNNEQVTVSGFNSSITGTQTVTLNYNGITTSFDVTVFGITDVFKSDFNSYMYFLNEEYKTVAKSNNFYQRFADSEQNLISGFIPGIDNLESYIELNPEFSMKYSKVGTGETIEIYYKGELLTIFTMVIFGDTTGDGIYDGQDSVIINCIISQMLQYENIEDCTALAADINQDTKIDEKDIEILEKAGLLMTDVSLKQNIEIITTETNSDNILDSELKAAYEYIHLTTQSPIITNKISDIKNTDSYTDSDFSENTVEIQIETENTNTSQSNLFKLIIKFILQIFTKFWQMFNLI